MNTNIIYKAMKHYRTKFLIIEAVLIAVFVCFFAASFPYILNIFEGAVAFDENYYADSVNMIKVGEEFEIHRNDEKNIPGFTLKDSSHWQGKRYEFKVPVTDVRATGISYTNAATGTGTEEISDETSAVLYVAKIGTKDTLVLAYPHEDLTKTGEVTGIFTSVPFIVKYDVAKSESFSESDTLCEYMLDTRGLEMESEQFDLIFSIALLAIVIFLGIKLLLQYKNYRCTPTYSQLEKYGLPDDVAIDVDMAIRGKEWVKGECEAERWIVTKAPFKLKIVRNYRTHGKFEYVKKS